MAITLPNFMKQKEQADGAPIKGPTQENPRGLDKKIMGPKMGPAKVTPPY